MGLSIEGSFGTSEVWLGPKQDGVMARIADSTLSPRRWD